MATRTRTFGAGNRESHDASDFYARFTAPELSDDETVNPCRAADSIFCGDARDMHQIDDNSVALVVTSPPYFAGKAYETDLEAGHIPSTYLEYLTLLRDVFAECANGIHQLHTIDSRVMSPPSSRTSWRCCCAARSSG